MQRSLRILPIEQPKTVRMVLARGQRHCCLRRPAATIAVSLVVRFNLTMLRFHVPRDAQLTYQERTKLPGSTRGEVGVNNWWHSQSRDKYGCRFLHPESQVWEQVLIHHVWWIRNKQPETSEMDCHRMFVEVPGA